MSLSKDWQKGLAIAWQLNFAIGLALVPLAPLWLIPKDSGIFLNLAALLYALIVFPYSLRKTLAICGQAIRPLDQGSTNRATRQKNAALERENSTKHPPHKTSP